MIRWKCPHCQSTLSVPDWAIGRRVPCPVCTNGIKVPPSSEDDPELDEEGNEKKKKTSCCGCIVGIAILIFIILVIVGILK
ncbi:MAG TPA: hypothetical protein VL860_08735 [Planctomycetota bacterium]|nr:hypothetical protein [Planctomycetota bacterium]